MLYVYLSEEEVTNSGLEVIRNPADYLDIIGIKDTPVIRDILNSIENAKYLNNSHFLTRFDEKIPIEFISTGSKVAIVASLVSDKIIDLRECGINARDFILCNIDNAHVLMYSRGYGIGYEEDEIKEFSCNGYIFKTVADFANYVYRDYPDEPDI